VIYNVGSSNFNKWIFLFSFKASAIAVARAALKENKRITNCSGRKSKLLALWYFPISNASILVNVQNFRFSMVGGITAPMLYLVRKFREEGRKGGREEGRKGGREEGRKGGREEGRKGREDKISRSVEVGVGVGVGVGVIIPLFTIWLEVNTPSTIELNSRYSQHEIRLWRA
jgi:hypothetical protein